MCSSHLLGLLILLQKNAYIFITSTLLVTGFAFTETISFEFLKKMFNLGTWNSNF